MTDEARTPAEDRVIPPTREETDEALANIESAERRAEAAAALRELAESVIRTVTAVDRSHNCGAYLTRMEIIAVGEGHFELRIHEKDTGVDPDEIARQVQAAIEGDEQGYGKQLRPVQLGFGPGGLFGGRPTSQRAEGG